RNLEEQALSTVGKELYDAVVRGYTIKQWGIDPTELPASIIKRLPIRFNYDTAYFGDKHQGVPTEGYGRMFERMLAGADVETGVDYLKDRESWDRCCRERVVFTGPLDAFFSYELGALNWRSSVLETQVLPVDDYQGCAVMNYTSPSVPFTRTHEFKHLA